MPGWDAAGSGCVAAMSAQDDDFTSDAQPSSGRRVVRVGLLLYLSYFATNATGVMVYGRPTLASTLLRGSGGLSQAGRKGKARWTAHLPAAPGD